MNIIKYIISGLLFSLGLGLWYYSPDLIPEGNISILIGGFFLNWKDMKKPIKFKLPNWNAEAFFKSLSFFSLLALLLVTIFLIGSSVFRSLLGAWYFIVILWISMISMLVSRYFKEQREI